MTKTFVKSPDKKTTESASRASEHPLPGDKLDAVIEEPTATVKAKATKKLKQQRDKK